MFINMFKSKKLLWNIKLVIHTTWNSSLDPRRPPTNTWPPSPGGPGPPDKNVHARRRTRRGVPNTCVPSGVVYPCHETWLFRSSSHVNTRFRSLLHLLAQYEPVSNFQLRPTHDQDADHNLEKIMEPQKFPAFRLKIFLTHDFENHARNRRLSKCRYSRPKRHSIDTTGVADNKASLPSSASIV